MYAIITSHEVVESFRWKEDIRLQYYAFVSYQPPTEGDVIRSCVKLTKIFFALYSLAGAHIHSSVLQMTMQDNATEVYQQRASNRMSMTNTKEYQVIISSLVGFHSYEEMTLMRYCWRLGKLHVDIHFWWVHPNFDPDFQRVLFRGDTIIAPLQRGQATVFGRTEGATHGRKEKVEVNLNIASRTSGWPSHAIIA